MGSTASIITYNTSSLLSSSSFFSNKNTNMNNNSDNNNKNTNMNDNKNNNNMTPFQQLSLHSIIGKGGFAIVYKTNENYKLSSFLSSSLKINSNITTSSILKSKLNLNFQNKKKQNIYAVKINYFKNPILAENQINMTLNELKTYKYLPHHPFIVNCHYGYREHLKCYLILDYYSGADLRYHLLTHHIFQEQHVAYIIACIGSALNHLHKNGIIHRDIKPENILLSEKGVPYLSDFGTSYLMFDNKTSICCLTSGTVSYVSPEALTVSRRHSYQSDFWSLGVMAFELLFNSRPFHRHCPKRFIYFVDNQYHFLWDHLQNMSYQSITFCDFETIEKNLNQKTLINDLPYPEHYIPLNNDGSLPIELKVSIPTSTFYGDNLSQECILMLHSLLDVRITQRLGNITKFHLFSNHPWFIRYNYHDKLKSIQPPFQPNILEIEKTFQNRFSNDPSLKSFFSSVDLSLSTLAQSASSLPSTSSSTPSACNYYFSSLSSSSFNLSQSTPIPQHIEEKLQQYHYIPPNMNGAIPHILPSKSLLSLLSSTSYDIDENK